MNKKKFLPRYHRLILVIYIISIQIPFTYASMDSDSDLLLADGVTAYNAGDFQSSLEIFESITINNPSWPYGWLWKGTVLSDMGSQKEAEIAFKTGICLLNPEACQDFENKDIHDQYQNMQTLYPYVQHSIINTQNQVYQKMAGSVFSSEEKPFSDYSEIDHLNSNNSQNPELLEKMGDKQQESGILDDAIHSYTLASQIDPDNPDYSRKAGDSYAKKGNYSSALHEWNRSLESESDKVMKDQLVQKRSDVLSSLNQSLDAAKELERISTPVPNPEILVHKGELYYVSREYQLAETSYLECLSLFPENIDASLGLAQVRIRQGQYQQGKDVLDSIPQSSLSPQQGQFFNQLQKQIPSSRSSPSENLSGLFSRPELYIFAIIGVGGVIYCRKKIFQ